MPFVFLLFVVMPIIEIWVLIEVGSRVGVFNTVLLVILTAVIGTMMLRAQGLAILNRVRSQMASNQLPAREMLEGVFLVFGGALLLTPGFVTDTVGFLCLIPATRAMMASALSSRFSVRASGAYQAHQTHHRVHSAQRSNNGSDTIEGEYRRED